MEMKTKKPNSETLADRMKKYEAVTTELSIVPNAPVYARIDMRAGHSFTKNLGKPFDVDYANAIKAATTYIVEKTGALWGYCQSDEASFIWEDTSKIPFETRLFKLQSVLASMFTAAFFNACLGTRIEDRACRITSTSFPSFDCRVCSMPSLEECINMLLWRERDCLKNAITLVALEHFSNKQIHKKSGEEKIAMLRDVGVDFSKDIDEDFRYGSWFKRVVFQRELDAETLAKIPEKQKKLDELGRMFVTRSEVRQMKLGMPLSMMANRVEVLVNGATPVLKMLESAQ